MLIPREVLAIRKCASTEKSRYSMDGVFFERGKDGKAKACATDGKALVACSWDDVALRGDFPDVGVDVKPVDGFAATVPVEALDKALKNLPKKIKNSALAQVALGEERVDGSPKIMLATSATGATSDKVETMPTEGHFPPYEDVLPKGEATLTVGFNVELLYEVARAVVEAGGGKGALVKLEFFGPMDACRVTANASNGVSVVGAVMPISLKQ